MDVGVFRHRPDLRVRACQFAGVTRYFRERPLYIVFSVPILTVHKRASAPKRARAPRARKGRAFVPAIVHLWME